MQGNAKAQVDFKAIKQSVSMRDILHHLGLIDNMKPKGKHQLVGPCPFSTGKSRTALKIDTTKNVWYSFAVGEGGDIISFVARMEGLAVRDAAILIADWFGITTSTVDDAGDQAVGDPSPPRSSGYIRQMERDLRQLLNAGDAEAIVRFAKEKCIESYRNGFDHGSGSAN